MIVYGKNVAYEVLKSNKKINRVFLSKNFKDEKLIKKLGKYNISFVLSNQLNEISNGNHQGIVLDIEDYKYYDLEEILNDKFLVILDHLEDPHNFGAIIRTCEAAGVDAIIIPKNRNVKVNSTVMKVSAGALNNIKIVEVSNISTAIEKLKKHNFWIYGTDLVNSEKYSNVKYDEKTVLVIGAEGNGISKLIREKCDFMINIPMQGKINSLNASVAAGIIIYEVIRQRDDKKNDL